MGLAAARKLAQGVAIKLQQGVDPIKERKALRGEKRDDNEKTRMTLKRAVTTYLSAKKSAWSKDQKDKWETSFKHHVYPKFGTAHVNQIDDATVRQILEPIWDTKTATAKQLRRKLELVLGWAAYMGYRPRGENPAAWKDRLDTHFGKGKNTQNRAALLYQEIPAFMKALQEKGTIAAYAFQFLILTAARTDDVLSAKWDQINLDKNVWTIPGRGTVKMMKDFPVPLSDPAIAILREMEKIRTSEYIFPGQVENQPLNESVLRWVKTDLKRPDMTPHGCRSTFKTWASEETDFENIVSEMALAHVIDSKVEAAYRRGVLFTKRTGLMKAWGEYCIPPTSDTTGNVVPPKRVKNV